MGYFSPHISKAILKVAYNIDNDVLLSYLITNFESFIDKCALRFCTQGARSFRNVRTRAVHAIFYIK